MQESRSNHTATRFISVSCTVVRFGNHNDRSDCVKHLRAWLVLQYYINVRQNNAQASKWTAKFAEEWADQYMIVSGDETEGDRSSAILTFGDMTEPASSERDVHSSLKFVWRIRNSIISLLVQHTHSSHEKLCCRPRQNFHKQCAQFPWVGKKFKLRRDEQILPTIVADNELDQWAWIFECTCALEEAAVQPCRFHTSHYITLLRPCIYNSF